MISFPPFLVLEQPCEEASVWVTKQLGDLGLHVVTTFDMRMAQIPHTDCPCPYHGTDQCDCQLCVLLIYKAGTQPATLLVHGHDGRSWLSLINTPQQPVEPRFEG